MAQTTNHVLLVKPSACAPNPHTTDNYFQGKRSDASQAATDLQARVEFEGLKRSLEQTGVKVNVFSPGPQVTSPDAHFPNNWFSTHADGTLVLYPMMAPNRRTERLGEALIWLRQRYKNSIDLSEYEAAGEYLEGTGSLVLDRVAKIAYAALSHRTISAMLTRWCKRFGYSEMAFDACDQQGHPIYHTNCMLAVGSEFAVICSEAIADSSSRDQVLNSLKLNGKRAIEISFAQMRAYCANLIELKDQRGNPLIVMSQRARNGFTPLQIDILSQYGTLVSAPLETIEELGGGSARCMIAELF